MASRELLAVLLVLSVAQIRPSTAADHDCINNTDYSELYTFDFISVIACVCCCRGGLCPVYRKA